MRNFNWYKWKIWRNR